MVPIEPYEENYKVPAELSLCEPATCRCEHETREPIAQCEGSSLQLTPRNPGQYENGEYEVDHLTVVTRNHKLFRLHCKDWDADPTVEPLAHLKNAPTKVEESIKADESSDLTKLVFINSKNKYSKKITEENGQQSEVPKAKHKNFFFHLHLINFNTNIINT